jgi:ATP-dependent DNA helicase RecG
LFEQVEATLETLRAKYLKAYISYEGVQRLETYLFPFGALREALLNAVVHKDYSSGIPIQISVYAHQIVLWNPGHLPDGWTMQQLLGKHPSRPANPLLANAFFRAGYIESWGRGIEKITRECREHGVDSPVYDFSMSGLMLSFRANPAHLAAALGEEEAQRVLVQAKLPGLETTHGKKTPVETLVKTPVETPVKMTAKTPERILAALAANPELSLAEVAVAIGKSASAVERAAAKLVKAGRLRRIGPAKGGYWELTDE